MMWSNVWKGLKRLLPEPFEEVIELDEQRVRCTSNGRVAELLWADLVEISILTSSRGPWVPDVFFRLRDRHRNELTIGSEKAREVGLLPRLQELPGFDNEAVMLAMGCCDDKSFLCWKRSS